MIDLSVGKKSNFQDLLKAIALLLAAIDHIGLFFFPDQMIFRLLGRPAMPIFAYFRGYNYRRINKWILLCGVILQLLLPGQLNILFSLFLGQLLLWADLKLLIRSISFWLMLPSIFIDPFPLEYTCLPFCFMVIGHKAKMQRLGSQEYLELFIALAASTIYAYLRFRWDINYIIANICMFVVLYLLLVGRNMQRQIYPGKMRILSRNSLLLFTGHLILLILVKNY